MTDVSLEKRQVEEVTVRTAQDVDAFHGQRAASQASAGDCPRRVHRAHDPHVGSRRLATGGSGPWPRRTLSYVNAF